MLLKNDGVKYYQSVTLDLQSLYRKRLSALDGFRPDYETAIELTNRIIELLKEYNNIPAFKAPIEYRGKKLYPHNTDTGAIVYRKEKQDNVFIPLDCYHHIEYERDMLKQLISALAYVR